MAANTTIGAAPTAHIAMLDSFVPGFSILSRLIEGLLGIDITWLVSFGLLIAAAFSAGGYAWSRASKFLLSWFTSSIYIRSSDEIYKNVMYYHSKHGMTQNSRNLGAETSTQRDNDELLRSLATRGERFDYAEIESAVSPDYILAYGSHYFWHNGRLFILERRKEDGLVLERGSTSRPDRAWMRITCIGWSPGPIKEFLMHCKRWCVRRHRNVTTIYRAEYGTQGHWQRALTRPSRPLDTIYMDEGLKASLIDDINEYLDPAAPTFYARRGIPYRRGYLFHGPPGTGKTSVSLALAGHYGCGLYIVSLMEPHMTEQKLSALFAQLPPHCIVLIEDIDSAGLEKRDLNDPDAPKKQRPTLKDEKFTWPDGLTASEKVAHGITLAGLLNAIDGVASHEGRILILTTNDPESLDQALIRPGRVDMQINFGKATKYHVKEIFYRMFLHEAGDGGDVSRLTNSAASRSLEKDTSQAHSAEPELELEDAAARFADLIPDDTFTPAEVQGYLLTRKKDRQKALEEAKAWRDGLIEAKARRRNVINIEDKAVENYTASERK